MPTNTESNDTDQQDYAYAMQILDSMAFPMTMTAAIELDLFEIIARAGPDGKLSAEDIAAQLNTKNPEAASMLDRLLCLLATFSVITCSLVTTSDNKTKKLYGLAPVCKYFVKDEDGVSLCPMMLLNQDKVFHECRYRIKDAVIEGGSPFHMVHGMQAFEFPETDESFNKLLNTAMFNHTTIVMKKIIQSYNGFQGVQQLVDVGGGYGTGLKVILSHYPNIRAINFDLPHVIQTITDPCPGIKYVGGNMFEGVPSGDAIFMKYILHDWDDDHCLKLLNNCYEAIPEDGKVIVVDSVVPEEPETTDAAKAISEMDVEMMTLNPGGKERTREEFIKLANGSGFTQVKFESFVCNFWVMEFCK